MKIELDIDRERGIARYRLSGPFDPEVLLERIDALPRHPHFTPGMASLYDVSELQLETVARPVLERIGRKNRDHADARGDAKVAVYARTELQFGLARMFTVVGESPNLDVRAFRDYEEAERWLLEGRGA